MAITKLTPRHFGFLIAVLYVLLRLVRLDSTFLWLDDIATIADSDSITQLLPWRTEMFESVRFALIKITGPILPTLVVRGIASLFGLQIFLLRLPALLVSIATFFLLDRILVRIVSAPAARYSPLLLYTLSVPAIIFSQAIQPSIFYCLATLIQLYVIIRGVQRLGASATMEDITSEVYRLSYVSAAVFFMNYMSSIVFGILMLYLLLYVVFNVRGWMRSRHDVLVLVQEVTIAAIPVVLLSALRLGLGGATRHYFEGIYYPAQIGDLAKLTYDFLSYHLNFAYDAALYEPLGSNWIAVPFVLCCLFGLFAFMRRSWWQGAFSFGSLGLVAMTGYLNIMPIGGVRHTFTFAPFVFSFIGYGIEALSDIRIGGRPSVLSRWVSVALVSLACLIFIYSGWHLYPDRKSTIDLDQLVAVAKAHDIDYIVGYRETYAILAIWDDTANKTLHGHGLKLISFESDKQPDEPYLLVSHRTMLDPVPAWPPLTYEVALPRAPFADREVTPLIENIGPLDPLQRRMVVQSIYYPLNGFFVYKIDP